MGKTKTAIIDDSVVAEEVKKAPKKEKDALVASLNEMLGEMPEAVEKKETGEKKQGTEEKEEKPAKVAPKKVAPKAAKEKPRSKKYQEAANLIDKNIAYPLNEAVELAKKVSYSKYDGTFEVHLSTNAKNVRGLVSLPYASGKQVKIIAFGKDAAECGADLVGDEAALAEIARGKINFDVLVTTPEWMPKMAGLAKVLGPRGLMPNPKNGTITTDLKKAVSEIQTGKLEYKTENNGKVMHLALGKISQPTEELSQNVKILITTIGKSKIRKATLAPTLGPGVKLDISSI